MSTDESNKRNQTDGRLNRNEPQQERSSDIFKEKLTANFYLTSFTRLNSLTHFFSIHLLKHFEALAQLEIFHEIKNASEWLSLQAAHDVSKSGLVSFRFEKQRTQGDLRAQHRLVKAWLNKAAAL